MVYPTESFFLEDYLVSSKEEYVQRSKKTKRLIRNRTRTGKSAEYMKYIRQVRGGCGRYCRVCRPDGPKASNKIKGCKKQKSYEMKFIKNKYVGA